MFKFFVFEKYLVQICTINAILHKRNVGCIFILPLNMLLQFLLHRFWSSLWPSQTHRSFRMPMTHWRSPHIPFHQSWSAGKSRQQCCDLIPHPTRPTDIRMLKTHLLLCVCNLKEKKSNIHIFLDNCCCKGVERVNSSAWVWKTGSLVQWDSRGVMAVFIH